MACSLVVPYILPCVADRTLARTWEKAMLSFSSCTSCKFVTSKQHSLSHPFCTSGKLTASPDQATFNLEEELKRLVWNSSSEIFSPLKSLTDSSIQRRNQMGCRGWVFSYRCQRLPNRSSDGMLSTVSIVAPILIAAATEARREDLCP